MRRKPRLRPAVVITFGVASFAAACSNAAPPVGSRADAGNPPAQHPCPLQPALGSPCDAQMSCTYGPCSQTNLICTGPGKIWEQGQIPMNPPYPADCPLGLPAAGALCPSCQAGPCIYDCSSGPTVLDVCLSGGSSSSGRDLRKVCSAPFGMITASCNANAQWELTPPSCGQSAVDAGTPGDASDAGGAGDATTGGD
jgi:hypothetical protein